MDDDRKGRIKMNQELWNLTILGMKGRKKITILIFTVLLLSFAFAVVTLSVTSSMERTNREYRFDTYGEWYGAFSLTEEGVPDWLKQENAISAVGCAETYASLSGTAEKGYLGTVDETLQETGRLTLLEGHMPQQENEIALEADILSSLGYDYAIGQKIVIMEAYEGSTADGELDCVEVEQEYILSGVLKEYTNLWLSGQDVRLPGAIITKKAAEQAYEEAVKESAELGLTLNDPQKIYFFATAPGMEQQAEKAFERHNQKFMENKAAYQTGATESYHFFYTCLIFAVTILAVLCIYMIYLQKQTRQIALFRTIGITRRQLCVMLFYETICLSVPAMLFGSLLGGAFTRGLLKAFMKTSLAHIYLDIPVKMLLLTGTAWMLCVFATRLIVYVIALKQPLTGRMYMTNKKALLYRRMHQILCGILASIFCGVTVFMAVEALHPLQKIRYWRQLPAYLIYAENTALAVTEGDTPELVTTGIQKQIFEVPGVAGMDGIGSVSAKLVFGGMEKNELACNLLVDDKMDMTLKIVSEENDGAYFNIEETGADGQAFWNGDCVIAAFPGDLDGNISYNNEKFTDCGIKKGDQIEITLEGQKIKGTDLGRAKEVSKISAVVDGFLFYSHDDIRQSLSDIYEPYTIVCSDRFFQKLLDQAEEGYLCGSYVTGQTIADTQINVYTELNAGYLSTDYVVAGICAEKKLQISNNREKHAAYTEGYIQNLILLWSSGGCIAVILLLIMGNLLTMDMENEKRKYAILQAIGMSRRQVKRQLWKKALKSGSIAVVMGWIFYSIYLCSYAGNKRADDMTLKDAILTQIYGRRVAGADLTFVFLLTATGFLVICFLYLFTKWELADTTRERII